MRKEETNRLSMLEDELPSPNELVPLTTSLITPTLALTFDLHHHHHHPSSSSPSPQLLSHYNDHHLKLSSPIPLIQPNSAASLAELGGGYGVSTTSGRSEEPARTLKKPRLAWTPELHQKFVDAVAILGIKNAVPKSIMHLMNVDGLTRENIASHLQKYRIYLKKIQGEPGGSSDPTIDPLFVNSVIPPHFLYQDGGGGIDIRPISEPFMPHIPVTTFNHHQMAATVMGHQAQCQNHHQVPMGHLGPSQGARMFEHPFVPKEAQLDTNLNGMVQNNPRHVGEDSEPTTTNNDRKGIPPFPK